MLKGCHGNSLSVNLALPVLKGIKGVSGMIGKNKSQNQNQTKPNHFCPRNAFEKKHLATMFGAFLEARILHSHES